jgi:hypothetical protein
MSSADDESNPGSQSGGSSIDPVPDNEAGHPAEPGPTLAPVVIGVGCFAGVIGLFAWLILSGVWVSRAVSGEQTVYSWSIWTWLGPFVLALGCAVVGVLFACSGRMATAGGWLLILSLFPFVSGLVFAVMGIVVPDRYNVSVDPEQFTCRVDGEPVSIRFDQVREIHVAESWSWASAGGFPTLPIRAMSWWSARTASETGWSSAGCWNTPCRRSSSGQGKKACGSSR